jgi:hypothetical protein
MAKKSSLWTAWTLMISVAVLQRSPENKRRCLIGRAQDRYRVTTLLADLEILGIVHRTASIGTAVVGNDFEFIQENICNRWIGTPIPATARDHQQRLSLAAYFVVQFITFSRYAARPHHNLFGYHVVHTHFCPMCMTRFWWPKLRHASR